MRSRFVAALSAKFPTEDRGELEWMLGVSVRRNRAARTITLSQSLYIEDLAKRFAPQIGEGHTRSFDIPMEVGLILSPEDSPTIDSAEWCEASEMRTNYMSLVGALNWLATMTFPQIAYAISQLSRFVTNPGTKHYHAAVRVLTLRADSERPLEAYVDSSWLPSYSCAGAMIFFYGALFHWFAKTQRSVSLSSAEAEFFGAMLAAKELLFFRDLLEDLNLTQMSPTVIWSDSKSAVDLAFDPVAFKNTKHIIRAAFFLRDHVARRTLTLRHVSGSHMLADLLTKAPARPIFLDLVRRLAANDTAPVASSSDRQGKESNKQTQGDSSNQPPPSPPPSPPADGDGSGPPDPPSPPPAPRKPPPLVRCRACGKSHRKVDEWQTWDRCLHCSSPLCAFGTFATSGQYCVCDCPSAVAERTLPQPPSAPYIDGGRAGRSSAPPSPPASLMSCSG